MSRPVSQVSQGWRSIDDHQHQRDGNGGAPSPKPKRQLTKLPGGNKAVGAFFLSLVAYTFQTECAQYVQQALGYRKPFLSLYLGHSGFMLLFPMHLAFLCYTTKYPLSHYLHLIAQNLQWQLRTPSPSLPDPGPDAVRRRLSRASGRGVEGDPQHPPQASSSAQYQPIDLEATSDANKSRSSGSWTGPHGRWIEERLGFDAIRLFGLLAILTLGITVPALSWYSAVPMTSMADITAIYNTFSVWALVFSVWFLGEKWEKRKVFSVLLACFGVVVVAYGGADHRKQPKEIDPVYGEPNQPAANATVLARTLLTATVQGLRERAGAEGDGSSPPAKAPPSFSNPVLGAFLAFVGAVTMAAYEMAFKLIGTLPDEAKQRQLYSAVRSSGNRRSTVRSYGEYRGASIGDAQASYEGQNLLDGGERSREANGDGPAGTERALHVLGESEGNNDEAAGPRGLASTWVEERASIWNRPSLGEGDPMSYQTMTPPLETANEGKPVWNSGAGTTKKTLDGVTVQARAVRYGQRGDSYNEDDDDDEGEEDVTESELDEGEAEEIQHGAHKLRRNPSYASTKRQSRISRSRLQFEGGNDGGGDDDDDQEEDEQEEEGGGSGNRARSTSIGAKASDRLSIPPPLPFGLHANLMTSGIGLVTFSCLWIGLPISHLVGWERFELPANAWTVLSIAVVVLCGVMFNAAFMILLSLWGPVLASVSCLMTTVLVEVADVLLGRELKWASVVGCGFVAAGFAVLVGGEGMVH